MCAFFPEEVSGFQQTLTSEHCCVPGTVVGPGGTVMSGNSPTACSQEGSSPGRKRAVNQRMMPLNVLGRKGA